MPSIPIWASTNGCTASWERSGEPSVTTPHTRSGRPAASALAKMPPRLWPMITTRSPVDSASASSRASIRSQAAAEQLTFARMPADLVHQPAARSQWVSVASDPSPARKPGISSTPRPFPSGTPAPRWTSERSRAAHSRGRRPSRHSGGTGGSGGTPGSGTCTTIPIPVLCLGPAGWAPNFVQTPSAVAVCNHRPRCWRPPSVTARSPSRSTRIPSRRPGSCSSACAPPGSTARTCCRSAGTTRPRPARRPTSPGWSWPARSSRWGATCCASSRATA